MCNLESPGILERFVRVKTLTEASRDANWDLFSSPSSETDSHGLAFSYVAYLYVFEFVYTYKYIY